MTKDLGVPPEADQVSGKKNKKPETCWSEAEIPSEAKRQRETLKLRDLVLGIWDLSFCPLLPLAHWLQ